MGRKNMAVVRRTTNRADRPTAGDASPLSTDSNRLDFSTDGSPLGKLYYIRPEIDTAWLPNSSAVLKLMVSFRLSAALWSTISDCDEVFNYWEPLHLLLYGDGLQTWEYSPLYAIRSYFYIYLHYIPANILSGLFSNSKIAVFIVMRCLLGMFCLAAEFMLFKAISSRISISVGRYFLLFSVLSTGMFISCSAFLPSTFAMILNMFAVAAYLHEMWFVAVMCTAISTLVGWPFAALLGIPIAVDMLFIRNKVVAFHFVYLSFLALITVGGSLLIVDSYYYGNRVFAPLNIVLYNVFSGHGPDLYGVESVSYYVKNILLNWNLAGLLVPLGLPLSAIAYFFTFNAGGNSTILGIPVAPSYWKRFSPIFLIAVSMYAWLFVFFSQPHKEERFLFPVYPLFALFAALALDAIGRLSQRFFSSIHSVLWLFMGAFIIISISRSYALHWNYGAHMEVYKSLNEHLADVDKKFDFGGIQTPIGVCVGKEWYRFPSSFFLPSKIVDKHGTVRKSQLLFLKSEFRGLLPKYYPEGRLPYITRQIPTEMNDLNKEEVSRYVNMERCDFVVDVDSPPDMVTVMEPNFGTFGGKFVRIASHPFLLSSKSHWFFRAFYLPYLTPKYTRFTSYSLYKKV